MHFVFSGVEVVAWREALSKMRQGGALTVVRGGGGGGGPRVGEPPALKKWIAAPWFFCSEALLLMHSRPVNPLSLLHT